MVAAKTGDIVAIEYTIKTKDGRVIDSTNERGADTLKIGETKTFPQIMTALDGMEVGAQQEVIVPFADACGPRREELVGQVPRENFLKDQDPQVGMTLTMNNKEDGSSESFIITEVNEKMVTLDGNHPLAGEDFHIDLKLVEIKQAG